MKIKNISDELDKVFISFLNMFDEECKNILKEKAYFAGGCIYSLANDKKVNDYDIFLSDNIDMQKIIDLPFWKCKTEYALSFGKFQIVTKYFGDPVACVGEFDFKHNMFYYKPFTGDIKKACNSFNYLKTDRLIFNSNRARDIAGVFLRIEKFKKRGFVIPSNLEKQILRRTSKKEIHTYKQKKRSNRHFY